MIKFLKDRKSINLPYVEVTQTFKFMGYATFLSQSEAYTYGFLHLDFD